MRYVPVSIGLMLLVALIVAVTLFEIRVGNDETIPSAGLQSPSFPGVHLSVIAEGQMPIPAVERELAGGIYNRAHFEGQFPELAPLLPVDFDFENNFLLFWVRPAPGPFGAGDPHLRAVSGNALERQMTIDWGERCGVGDEARYILIEAPQVGFSGGYWSVRHEVEPPSSERAVNFALLSTGGWVVPRPPPLVVLESRDDYLAFLSEFHEQPDQALDAFDFETAALVLSFGSPGQRRPLQRIVVDGNSARAFAASVTQYGPVPAVEAYIYEAYSVVKSQVAGVSDWSLLEDTDPTATGCE